MTGMPSHQEPVLPVLEEIPPNMAVVVDFVNLRAAGFYWVRDRGRWIVAEWAVALATTPHPSWLIPGSARPWHDWEIEEVGERVERRTADRERLN